MKLLRSLLVFYLVNLSSVCYSQVDIYTINLHGDKKKGTLESFIKIPVDSLNNLMLNSIKGVLCQIEWVNLTLNVKKTKDVQSKGIVCEGTHGGEAMVYTRG